MSEAERNEELEAKILKSALQELSALDQASEAYQAQLAAEAKLEKAVGRIDALESLRPVWAEGWTNDSMAAQASGSALAEIWEMLGAKNQTQAVIKIKELKGETDE